MQTTNHIERRVVEASLNRAKQLVLTQAWLGKAVGLRFAQGALSDALASLFSTNGSALTPTERLTAALECAAHFSAGVIGPYVHEQGGAA